MCSGMTSDFIFPGRKLSSSLLGIGLISFLLWRQNILYDMHVKTSLFVATRDDVAMHRPFCVLTNSEGDEEEI